MNIFMKSVRVCISVDVSLSAIVGLYAYVTVYTLNVHLNCCQVALNRLHHLLHIGVFSV